MLLVLLEDAGLNFLGVCDFPPDLAWRVHVVQSKRLFANANISAYCVVWCDIQMVMGVERVGGSRNEVRLGCVSCVSFEHALVVLTDFL